VRASSSVEEKRRGVQTVRGARGGQRSGASGAAQELLWGRSSMGGKRVARGLLWHNLATGPLIWAGPEMNSANF
jgi:hypothetical protein